MQAPCFSDDSPRSCPHRACQILFRPETRPLHAQLSRMHDRRVTGVNKICHARWGQDRGLRRGVRGVFATFHTEEVELGGVVPSRELSGDYSPQLLLLMEIKTPGQLPELGTVRILWVSWGVMADHCKLVTGVASQVFLAYAWVRVCDSSWNSTLEIARQLTGFERWPAWLRQALFAMYPAYFVYSSSKRLAGPDSATIADSHRYFLLLSAAAVLLGIRGARAGYAERGAKAGST